MEEVPVGLSDRATLGVADVPHHRATIRRTDERDDENATERVQASRGSVGFVRSGIAMSPQAEFEEQQRVRFVDEDKLVGLISHAHAEAPL